MKNQVKIKKIIEHLVYNVIYKGLMTPGGLFFTCMSIYVFCFKIYVNFTNHFFKLLRLEKKSLSLWEKNILQVI